MRLEINSLGQPDERRQHRAELIAYLEQHADLLDEDAQRRLHSNPLRILDTKNPAMQAAGRRRAQADRLPGRGVAGALRRPCKAMLDANGIAYRVNPRLVRGMDYYNLTVFEWSPTSLGAQGTVCGGGRYDDLIEQIGGKPAPAVGLALGIERVLELVQGAGRADPAAGARRLCGRARRGSACRVVLRTLQALARRRRAACRCTQPRPKAWAA